MRTKVFWRVTQIIFFIVFIASCDSSQKTNNKPNRQLKTTIQKEELVEKEAVRTPATFIDTIKMKNSTFVVFQSVNSISVTKNKDTVFVLNENNNGADFKDFNGDGYTDIIIRHLTNVPAIYELALYNSTKRKFILVQDFSNFPAPEKITNSNFYYSYHRSGCADANWDSDLFKIENNKAVRYGNIQGLGCEGEEKKWNFCIEG